MTWAVLVLAIIVDTSANTGRLRVSLEPGVWHLSGTVRRGTGNIGGDRIDLAGDLDLDRLRFTPVTELILSDDRQWISLSYAEAEFPASRGPARRDLSFKGVGIPAGALVDAEVGVVAASARYGRDPWGRGMWRLGWDVGAVGLRFDETLRTLPPGVILADRYEVYLPIAGFRLALALAPGVSASLWIEGTRLDAWHRALRLESARAGLAWRPRPWICLEVEAARSQVFAERSGRTEGVDLALERVGAGLGLVF